jgi:cytochrome c553
MAFFQAVFANEVPPAERACFACHGENGLSPNNLWPNLAGQKKDYLIKQLHDFRSGQRKNPLMEPFIKTLTEKDMEDVSQYFSELKVPK